MKYNIKPLLYAITIFTITNGNGMEEPPSSPEIPAEENFHRIRLLSETRSLSERRPKLPPLYLGEPESSSARSIEKLREQFLHKTTSERFLPRRETHLQSSELSPLGETQQLQSYQSVPLIGEPKQEGGSTFVQTRRMSQSVPSLVAHHQNFPNILPPKDQRKPSRSSTHVPSGTYRRPPVPQVNPRDTQHPQTRYNSTSHIPNKSNQSWIDPHKPYFWLILFCTAAIACYMGYAVANYKNQRERDFENDMKKLKQLGLPPDLEQLILDRISFLQKYLPKKLKRLLKLQDWLAQAESMAAFLKAEQKFNHQESEIVLNSTASTNE